MKDLQTVLDALCDSRHPKIHEAITIVKQMMQAEPVAWIEVFKRGGGEKNWQRRLVWEKPVIQFPALHGAEPLYHQSIPAPQAVPAGCEWTQDTQYESGDTYYSACGEAWVFNDGGPTDNRVSYCHHCGKKVQLAAAPKGAV